MKRNEINAIIISSPPPLPTLLLLADSSVDAGASSFATCLLPLNAFGFLRFYKWNLIAKNNKKEKEKQKKRKKNTAKDADEDSGNI